MSDARPTPILSVFAADKICIGFLLSRGRGSWEAFTADERSLGLFPDQREAVAAILERQPS